MTPSAQQSGRPAGFLDFVILHQANKTARRFAVLFAQNHSSPVHARITGDGVKGVHKDFVSTGLAQHELTAKGAWLVIGKRCCGDGAAVEFGHGLDFVII